VGPAGDSLDSFSHLWNGSDPDWVIVAGSDGNDDGALPYNLRTGMTELICDDRLADAVLRVMRDHGVPVVQPDIGHNGSGRDQLS